MSIDKPAYKEKLRIRSYEIAAKDSIIFIEIKKKNEKIVNKRRIFMSLDDFKNGDISNLDSRSKQILEEIIYLQNLRNVKPKVYISYEREAYISEDNPELRITFDRNVLGRNADLTLEKAPYGINILDEDKLIMEIKCNGAIPIQIVQMLSEQKIYPESFSKYGEFYKIIIKGDNIHVRKYNQQ